MFEMREEALRLESDSAGETAGIFVFAEIDETPRNGPGLARDEQRQAAAAMPKSHSTSAGKLSMKHLSRYVGSELARGA